ncbi:hypothetical protein MTR_5g023100 [Medicago truncatula]|uniref:Uncharacterized protein n=1 Tax=Medicago truncatula TaxID=3880 RepID=G7JYS5_MEDTR|nr:hypothetical protein MTR_5g023100 [Medicago truncatula]
MARSSRPTQLAKHQRNNQHEVRWQPPLDGCVKCNIDATLFGDQQCFRIGMYIQNVQSHFVKASTKTFEYFPTPSE